MSLSDEEKKLKQLKDDEEKRLAALGEKARECEEIRKKAAKDLITLTEERAKQLL